MSTDAEKKPKREKVGNELIYDQVADLVDEQKAILDRKKQGFRLLGALDSVGVSGEDVDALDRRDGNLVVGLWLKRPDYATKQRGEPANYRRFHEPIYYALPDAPRTEWPVLLGPAK